MTNAPAGTFNLPQEFQREHQLLHSRPRRRRPAIRPTQCAVASGAAARCSEAPSSARQGAPAPTQPSPAAPAGHQAVAARCLIQCCRPVPLGTKQHTPWSTSSCTAILGGAGRPSGRRSAPSHPALPPGVPPHQAAHAREHQLLHSRPQWRRPTITPTQSAVASGAAARCPTAPSSARRGAPAPAQPSPATPAGHQADAVRRCIRRCRPVPHGTKPRTSGSTSSCTAVPGGADWPSGRRRAPSHPALPPSAQGRFSQQLSVPSLLGKG
jgi:hypothetical protein